MVRPYVYVEAPPVTPLPYGLLSAAIVLDDLSGQMGMGVQYEPDACGEAHTTRAACEDGPDYGTLAVSVDAAGEASLTLTGAPTGGTYTVEWGDGETTVSQSAPNAMPHTYEDAGTYTVTITDNLRGYRAVVAVDVAEGEASGPFDADAAFSKVATEGIDLVTADPFTLYTLYRCRPVGRTDLEQRAANALRLGEQRALEQVMAERLAAATPVEVGAGVLHPAEGLAALEAYAARHYAGVPVIHAPRDVGSLLATEGAVMRSSNGARLETVQGALVASGGGYHSLAGPDTAGDGEAWLYVTGTVVVRRAPSADVTPLVMARAPQATNDAVVLAERGYAVSWECITAAVRVSTRPFTGGGGAL